MSKCVCVYCKAINPELGFHCHGCGEKYKDVKIDFNNELRQSLEHLKIYIAQETWEFFAGSGTAVFIERINHAIDHVIVDHCK